MLDEVVTVDGQNLTNRGLVRNMIHGLTDETRSRVTDQRDLDDDDDDDDDVKEACYSKKVSKTCQVTMS
ncbi:hypothetical protein NC653_029278 [Populus alba x Populus x berolinensis]|uniref:Uncharacterized protein n=1 Tax=Populus alba x Populus x berolinensis TaxID=444605 RepID=A0AAD6Q514_9ROSI|nr:hypothetical protein NC653_029278 [Populus alba x Populus x berolinensis]